ncbi:hypothetical protein VPH35_031783 [Triticum aestivum]
MEVTRDHLGLTLPLFLFLLLSPGALVTGVSDLLNEGSNITDGNTLVSAGGSFILGFFSPGVSTNRYLGIWFSVSNTTVCWVANRERPLNSTAGVLVFSDTGNLLLLDGSGQTVWTSNSTTTAAPRVAQLLESGNRVIREQAGHTTVWQSFDYLSDTLLPGMKMGKNRWTGSEWYLSSWRSADDPSPAYRFVTEVNGLPDNTLWDGSTKVYRTGPWNGLRFSGTTEAASYTNMFKFVVNINDGEVTFGYTATPGTPPSRIVATSTGFVKRLVWEASTQRWETFLKGPRDVCDDYAMCGPFGLCNANAPSTSFCSCPRGFTPASPAEWDLRENADGCQRSAALDCAQGNGSASTSSTDGFMVLQGVKLPDTFNASVDASATMEECRARCFDNCSCVAYAPADIRVGAVAGCIIWTGYITDLRYVDGGQDLYMRLPKSELVFPQQRVENCLVLYYISHGQSLSDANTPAGSRRDPASTIGSVPEADPPTIMEATEEFSEAGICVPPVDLPSIKAATNDFSDSNIIGKGGFGVVYTALLNGVIVAVKRLKPSGLTEKGKKDFTREVEVMSTVTHNNLVKLVSYCQEEDEWILVYEYMPNKSLSPYIFGENSSPGPSLTWVQRLEIIHGVAVGVEYLHNKEVIHRDLKLSNILLDHELKPKIADFGTAKLFIDDQTNPTVVQTPGYIAPEYAREAYLTLKCDVYSFGVVLLEIVSGKKNVKKFLLDAWGFWNKGKIKALLDSQVAEPNQQLSLELSRVIQIGLLCVQPMPDDRPSMPEVVVMLTDSSSGLAKPKKHVVGPGQATGYPQASNCSLAHCLCLEQR